MTGSRTNKVAVASHATTRHLDARVSDRVGSTNFSTLDPLRFGRNPIEKLGCHGRHLAIPQRGYD
jgi:hypothetical protein